MGGRATIVVVAIGLLLPAVLQAQIRRDPPIQPVGEVAVGSWLVGLGAAHAADIYFPVSGLGGDLGSLGSLTLAYGLAPRAILEIRGDLYRRLSIRHREPSSVPLDPEVEAGSTRDVGDFRLGLTLAPLGASRGLSAGGRLEVTLPNSSERKGIGTNTTDVRLSLLAGYGSGSVRVTGDMGVAILEAPLETFKQNDVFVYSAEILYRPAGEAFRVSLGLDGRANTRAKIPLGTEDRGEVQLGAEYGGKRWLADARLAIGYVSEGPAWAIAGGVAYRPRAAPAHR